MTMPPDHNSIEMRKQPSQDRSLARLETLFLEAEKLILEKGLVRLNVREVARRADTNIGTFYQYFPNRGSLTRAMVERYNAKLRSCIAEGLAQVADRDLRASLSVLQEKIFRFYCDNPVTLEIWPGITADPELRALDRDDSAQNAALLVGFLEGHKPRAKRTKIEQAADLIVLTTGPILRHAVHEPGRSKKALLAGHLDMIAGLIETL